ncbi:TPA: hypothetical protein ACH3X2_000987 [Trebouxia sp. C0005]
MTRKPNVRSRVLAARSSFWETLPQECASQLNCRASVSEPDCTTPSLYDQLLQLKDWTEERAELCFASPERQHDVVEGRPSAALLSTIQLTNPEEAAEVCNREDSAMRLADGRLSNSGPRHTAIPVFCQGKDTRMSSSSSKGARSSSSRRRSFCRSSFTATRSYETRMCRQRRRTFAMPELESNSNNNFQVILLETQPGMSEATNGSTMRNTLLGMAATSWGKADHMMRSMMRGALHQKSGQAHNCT